VPPVLADLPVFPLSTVLFPGGVLPLRIFEARYLDMVRQCMRQDTPFGVCLMINGSEVGAPAEHEAIGCLAHIRDWDMQQGGVLQIRTVGGTRFRIEQRRIAADRLIRADAIVIDDDADVPVPAEHTECRALIRRIVEDIERREPDAQARPMVEPYRVDSAGWVANRLAECLPIAGPAKHALMAIVDPLARLAAVHRWLKQNKVL
jgi:Lon protease-like protein